MKYRQISIPKDQYIEFLRIITLYEFQSPREAFDFLLFLARKYGGIEAKRWKRKQGLA